MAGAPERSILWIEGPRGGARVPASRPKLDGEVIVCRADEWETTLSGLASGKSAPLLAVLDAGPEALAIARKVHALMTTLPLVFLGAKAEEEKIRLGMRLSALLGAQWRMLDPAAAAFPELLAAELASARRRRRYQTTVQKINYQVQSSRELIDAHTLRRMARSERFLDTVVKQSADAIATFSAQGTVVSWNAGCQGLWGLTSGEAVGQKLERFFSPASRPKLTAVLNEIARTREPRLAEFEGQRPDGNLMLIEAALAELEGDPGNSTAFSLVARDITARKHAELHLRSQRDVLEQIVHGRPLSEILESLTTIVETLSLRDTVATILLVDPAGTRWRAGAGKNSPPAWSALIEGMPIGPLAGSFGAAMFRRERVITSDVTIDPLWTDLQAEAVRHGLRACWCVPILAANGSVLGAFAIYYREPGTPNERELELVEVITRTASIAIERKQAEAALAEHARILERRVAERTEQLSETIGELEAFSYTVSHDMRSPLRAMQTYAEILLAEHQAQLDPEGRHYLSRISLNAARLELLVRDVLAYSKVAKGQVNLQRVDLKSFVASLLASSPELNLALISTEISNEVPPVLAHDAYLAQVLSNLLGNAQKFVRTDVPNRIVIAARRQGEFVRLEIRDNGIGIEPEHFERIFAIFGRVHSEKKYEGTGIGLAIVQKAVQRMGGKIGVESTPGQGTSFWFTLRVARN